MEQSETPSRKRPKLTVPDEEDLDATSTDCRTLMNSLARPVSPPPLRGNTKSVPEPIVIQSPFQLTWVQDLPESSNVDAVSLRDLLGDPLISECWNFNYLHNLDFLMGSFDLDIKNLVKVHVIHGFWKKEDESRLRLKVNLTHPLNKYYKKKRSHAV